METSNTEYQRLSKLQSYQVLDTAAESDFDDIVHLASEICHTPISLITLIDEHRQWFKAKKGIALEETLRDYAFCHHAIKQDDIMVVQDARFDPRFSHNPLVEEEPHIRFYAGVPLSTPDGYKLGSLCVIDRVARELSDFQVKALKTLAQQVVNQLELKQQIRSYNEANLKIKLQNERLEKLYANNNKLLSIISHDLKAPLNNTLCLIGLLEENVLSSEDRDKSLKLLKTTLLNANVLFDDLLAWAVSQFKEEKLVIEDIHLHDLCAEIIESNKHFFDGKNNTPINGVPKNLVIKADKRVISFAFRNLMLNSNKFTSQGTVTVSAKSAGDSWQMSVSDSGVGMSQEQMDALFHGGKHTSTNGTSGEQGTGFGLMFCQDYIEKHRGSLSVESQQNFGSTFTFTIPKEAVF